MAKKKVKKKSRPEFGSSSPWEKKTMLMRGTVANGTGYILKRARQAALYITYPVDWDYKRNLPRALPQSSVRLFIFKLFVIPLNFLACASLYKCVYMKPGNNAAEKFDYIATVITTVALSFLLPLTWVIIRKDASVFVDMWVTMWKIEDSLTGMLEFREMDPTIDAKIRRRWNPAMRGTGLFAVYVVPVIMIFIAFSTENPYYTLYVWLLKLDKDGDWA